MEDIRDFWIESYDMHLEDQVNGFSDREIELQYIGFYN